MMRRVNNRSAAQNHATRVPSPARVAMHKAIKAVLAAGIAGNTSIAVLAEELSMLRATVRLGEAGNLAGCSAADVQALCAYAASGITQESIHAMFVGALRDAGQELKIPGKIMDAMRYGMNKNRSREQRKVAGGVLLEAVGTLALMAVGYVTIVILFSV